MTPLPPLPAMATDTQVPAALAESVCLSMFPSAGTLDSFQSDVASER
jgi:hypothetical protein